MMILRKHRSTITPLIIILMFISFTACEDVIDVAVPESEPRLIVDALVRVDTTVAFTPLRIKVSRTASFFESIEPAQVNQITITNENTNEFVILTEDPNDPGVHVPFPIMGSIPINGDAVPTDFLASGDRLTMTINDNGEIIIAFAQFIPTVPLDNTVQGDDILFDDDDTEVIITFTDAPDRRDFYVFDLDFGEFITTEDTFYQNQQFQFSFFYDNDLQAGQIINISILGADEPFYDYVTLLLEQSQQGDNGPFQTPAATVRGNFINASNIDNIEVLNNVDQPNNFILGYFAIAQEFKGTVIVE